MVLSLECSYVYHNGAPSTSHKLHPLSLAFTQTCLIRSQSIIIPLFYICLPPSKFTYYSPLNFINYSPKILLSFPFIDTVFLNVYIGDCNLHCFHSIHQYILAYSASPSILFSSQLMFLNLRSTMLYLFLAYTYTALHLCGSFKKYPLVPPPYHLNLTVKVQKIIFFFGAHMESHCEW